MSSHKRSRATFETNGPPSHAPYALYGTPLPAFDPEVRDDGSYVPVWKQEVTDERGRKRLHGAFTGGWSAGYFNTVGSKEGWSPATFVSSRANRAKPEQQRKAEDFMDDEDLAEQAESQKLQTQGDFAGLGSTTPAASKGMFSDLFKTTSETMGVKLLQRMGWRPGQGIGPKIRRLAQGDKVGEDHLFAPEDTRIINFVRKNDRKGLGFAGETSLAAKPDEDEDSDIDARILATRKTMFTKTRKPIKSSIGVGVLNDTGSDDEDPYSMGPQIKYNKIIGGDKRKKKGVISSTNAKPSKLSQRSTNVMAGFRKCHDGRLPIDGFVLTSNSVLLQQENQYPPPEVPTGWQSSKLQNSAPAEAYQSTAEAAKASTMDARARSAVLGEQQLPGKSIFDFMSSTARDKLAAASGKNLPQAGGEGRPEGFVEQKDRTLWDVIPRIEKETAMAALQRGSRGWMPYAEDEAKRARYKAFISLQAGITQTLPERPTGFSTDEWTKEMREFAQAAEVFKPISGLMASRFTSSSSQPQVATDRPDAAPQVDTPKDPAEEAAKVGMFGPMTRSRLPFRPTRLLCKRFNIKPPANVDLDPGDEKGESTTTDARSDLISKSAINQMMMHANFKAPVTATPAPHAMVDVGVNDALEGSRPDENTLKSIFETD